MADTFTGWVRDVLEFAHDTERRNRGRTRARDLLHRRDRASAGRIPATTSSASCCAPRSTAQPVPDAHVLGTAALTLIAGVDTTWSGIGAALWHLATHPDDRRRLVAEPELDAHRDRGAAAGLLAGHDGPDRRRGHRGGRLPDEGGRSGAPELPGRQPRPRRVPRRGSSRSSTASRTATSRSAPASTAARARTWPAWSCAVAVEEWLRRIPEFELADPAAVTWAGGQVRGPRHLEVVFP